MPHYQPKTEDQLAKEGLLPEGEYDFEVLATEEKTSSKGNPMYVLTLGVWDKEGNRRQVFDYITFGNNYGERKFRHAADTCGLLNEYAAGALTHESFLYKSGRVSVIRQESEGYNPKNAVKDYIKKELWGDSFLKEEPKKALSEDLSDDIPF